MQNNSSRDKVLLFHDSEQFISLEPRGMSDCTTATIAFHLIALCSSFNHDTISQIDDDTPQKSTGES